MNNFLMLAQQGGDGGGGMIGLLVWLAVMGVMIASMWKVFDKAGQPGWGCLVPFYNVFLMCKIANRPAWWMVLFFIPFVSIIAYAVISFDIAKSFGKGAGFGVGLFLLGFIFYPLLAFGSAEYYPPDMRSLGGKFDDRAMAA